ncbi:C69 family dipeptidase [bacterium]|nr:C69 family dipeptidase [bacterium]
MNKFRLFRFVGVVLLVFGFFNAVSACTIVGVGSAATTDGSVINANASDSRTTRTWLNFVPHQKYRVGAECPIFTNSKRTLSAVDLSAAKERGRIPQVAETFKYLNTGYPCMNEKQVSVTESTFGGVDTLRNSDAMFNCEELCRIIMERAATAREAIQIIDDLTQKYGYREAGEVLLIADKKEMWLLEIIGCGRHEIGAVWVAERIPDDHVTVSANGSRIRQFDLSQPDKFMSSKNIFTVAEKYGLWDSASNKPFEFAYVYGRNSRVSMATRRREWRVFNLLAPSVRLDPNASDFPLSVKPDTLVSVADVMDVLGDYYQGTAFDITKNITVADKDGQQVQSPYANPFMHYDMMPLFKINGGWGKMGERSIARYYCNYTVICQTRSWLPDPVGALVWHGFDNPATAIQIPIHLGATDLPAAYKVSGRPGFNRDCAWWAFNRVADFSAQKWGDMQKDVNAVRLPLRQQFITELPEFEKQLVDVYQKSPKKAVRLMTAEAKRLGELIVQEWWQLGDNLWSKYTGKF